MILISSFDSTELVKLEIDKNLIATLEINISTLRMC